MSEWEDMIRAVIRKHGPLVQALVEGYAAQMVKQARQDPLFEAAVVLAGLELIEAADQEPAHAEPV